jgi:holin-like protein
MKETRGFSMKYVFQFCRILVFCLLGELLYFLLPLPIPASIYGLVLLLLALKTGIVKLEQVRETGLFLTSILQLLFIPAAAGLVEIWGDIGAMIVPVLIALFPVTILVMVVSGRVTQSLAKKKEKV